MNVTYVSTQDEKHCVEVKLNVDTTSSTETFVEGNPAEFYCNFTEISEMIISRIKWTLNDDYSVTPTDIGGYLTNNNRTLRIDSLNHSYTNGFFDVTCSVILLPNDQEIKSDTRINVAIECKSQKICNLNVYLLYN